MKNNIGKSVACFQSISGATWHSNVSRREAHGIEPARAPSFPSAGKHRWGIFSRTNSPLARPSSRRMHWHGKNRGHYRLLIGREFKKSWLSRNGVLMMAYHCSSPCRKNYLKGKQLTRLACAAWLGGCVKLPSTVSQQFSRAVSQQLPAETLYLEVPGIICMPNGDCTMLLSFRSHLRMHLFFSCEAVGNVEPI